MHYTRNTIILHLFNIDIAYNTVCVFYMIVLGGFSAGAIQLFGLYNNIMKLTCALHSYSYRCTYFINIMYIIYIRGHSINLGIIIHNYCTKSRV